MPKRKGQASAASNRLPEPIRRWHDYVSRKPDRHCADIKALSQMVEGLLARGDVWYEPADFRRFERYCGGMRHTTGRWAGATFSLSREQRYFAACVLGVKTRDEELGCTVRYFTEGVLLVARKFGKSTFIALLAGFLLLLDNEPGAQVWCVATKKAQAGIVYDNTRAMLASSPVWSPAGNPNRHWRTKRDRDNSEMLMVPATSSYMKPGGKNSDTHDGLSPSAYVIDELHAIKDRATYDVFTSATGARTQPLGVIISTFGFVRESIFDSILKRCEDRLAGKSDERLFPMIFRLDKDDKPADESCWIKANPGIPEARPTMRYLRGEYQKALSDPAQMPSFLAKHLNRASSSSVVYFDLHQIDQCAGDMAVEMIRDRYAVGAADIAETTDLCCASALVPLDGKLHLFQRYFIASSRIEQNSKQDQMAYESFTRTGATDPLNDELLQICEGSMVSRRDVAAWFQMLVEQYGVTLWKVGADRWHIADFAEDMQAAGFPREDKDGYGVVFEVAQGAKTLGQPMKETRAIFDDQGIVFSRHNGLFRWCVTNTAARVDVNNNIQPDKKASRARIDGYSSYLMAYVAYKRVSDDFQAFQ